MDFERAFDTLVFGKSVPKLDSCLGLYCAPGVFYLSAVSMKNGKPNVEHLLRVPIPHKPETDQKSSDVRTISALNAESLADPASLAAVLKPVLDKFRHSPHVIVSLSSQFGLLRYFTIPPMSRRFWSTAIPAEARKLIPIPFSELVYDFQVRPMAAGPNNQAFLSVLFGVVYRKNLTDLMTLIQKLDLQLLGIELAPCSVERLWDTLAPSADTNLPYAHVHLEGSEGHILLSQQGWPVLSRTIQLTPEASPAERRKIDISGNIDFAMKQFKVQRPTQIRLSGVNKDLKGWLQGVTEEINIPARFQETAKALGLNAEEWGTYASIGGALRYITPTALTLDMSQYGRISDEDKQAVYGLFSIVGIVAAILAAIGGFRYAETYVVRNKLDRLRRQVDSVEEFRNKSPDQIQVLVKGLEEKVNAVRTLGDSKSASFMELLQVIQEDIPRPVWIEYLSYNNPLGNNGSMGQMAQKVLEVKGYAVSSDVGAAQPDALNQFQKSLQEDQRFERIFTCGMPSVRMEPSEQIHSTISSSAPGGSRNNGKQVSRMSFSLTCTGTTR